MWGNSASLIFSLWDMVFYHSAVSPHPTPPPPDAQLPPSLHLPSPFPLPYGLLTLYVHLGGGGRLVHMVHAQIGKFMGLSPQHLSPTPSTVPDTSLVRVPLGQYVVELGRGGGIQSPLHTYHSNQGTKSVYIRPGMVRMGGCP